MSGTTPRTKHLSAGLWMAGALALTACEAQSPRAGESNPLVGQAAPAFEAEKVTGVGPSSLQEAEGKVVILDFWGTYCDPCRKSFPKYQELVKQFGGDMAVIAVSTDEPEDKEKISEFVKATGVEFAIVWDEKKSAVKKYNPKSLPTSFIIDKQGVVRYVHSKFHAGDEHEIADEVKTLLK